MFSVETIYAVELVPATEQLFIHKSFIEDPSQFTLYGSAIDLIDTKDLLNFVLNVLECKVSGFSERTLSKLAVNLIPPLIRILRQKLCSFSANFKCIKRWDTDLYNALVGSVLHNNSRATWRRLFIELVMNDLDKVPNFDGSKGTVSRVNAMIASMINVVQSGDLMEMKNVLQNLSELSKWISPASISIETLNGWSLLHLAASVPLPVEIYQFIIESMELDILQMDRLGRTALHVAAASLNYNAIKVLTTKSLASIKILDFGEKSPLSLLLQSASMRPWRKWIESHNLQEIIAIFVRSNPSQLWTCTPVDTTSNSGVRSADKKYLTAKENLFYQAIVYTDDFVAEEVVKLARRSPPADWDITAITEALYRCAGRPRDRPATVELLFRELVTTLYDRELIHRKDLLDLLDCSICAALVSLKHTKLRRDVLKGLLERYVSLVQVSVGAEDQYDAQAVAFLYIAALCGDVDLLTFVLATLPRALVRALIYPHFMQRDTSIEEPGSASHFTNSFKSKLRRFCNTLQPESADFMVQSSVSPLSLMCALHRTDIVHVMLRASYEVRAHSDTPAGQAAAQQAEFDHFYPLYWAALCGAGECIRLVHTTLSQESLRRIYFHMPGPEKRSIFEEVLVAIGQALLEPTKSSRRTSFTSLRRHGTTRNYAECLQLVLECLPAANGTLNRKCSMTSEEPLHMCWVAPNPSQEAVVLLQTRLEQIESALSSICERVIARRESSDESQSWNVPYSGLVENYSAQKIVAQRVCAELSSKYIQTNLRLICKKFTPDKKWIKLAYCVNRLVRALPDYIASKSSSAPSVGIPAVPDEAPEVIDLSSWKSFISLMSKASKTTEQIEELTGVMTKALRNVFLPHVLIHDAVDVTLEESEQSYELLTAECAVIEQVWNDNQIVVLSRGKSLVPGPYGDYGDANQDSSAPPHYQVNDFKPDQRDVTTYAALQGWLVAMLHHVKDRYDCKRRCMGTSVTSESLPNETALEYIHAQQLRAEKERIQALLSCVPLANDTPVSPISYLLKYYAAEIVSTTNLMIKLHAELFHGGLCGGNNVTRRREESEKTKLLEMFDRLMCVLVEFNARLGCTTESLLRDVLPLCTLGLWKAAELIVKLASEHGHNLTLTQYNLMQRLLVCKDHTFPANDVICQYLVYSPTIGLLSATKTPVVHLLTPLHCAVMHRQGNFIKTFLSAFSDFPVNFESIKCCARDWTTKDWIHIFFSHCSGLQSHVLAQSFQASVWTEKRSPEDNYKGKVLVSDMLTLANAATASAKNLFADSKDPNVVLYPPFTLLRDANTCCLKENPHADSIVLLMNGCQVKWNELITNPRLLALATPAPQRAGGLFGTGRNLLHEAAQLSSPDLAFSLLHSAPQWRQRIFQADKTGCTALFYALQCGHLELADTMLRFFEHDVSMHKSRILSDLCAQQSAPSQKANSTVREIILQNESQELLVLENKLHIPRIRKTKSEMTGKLTPFYGLRDYAITGPVDVLARYLHGIDLLWKKILTADPHLLMYVFHYPGCAQLDSVIRARQVFALLGIPLSQVAIPTTDAMRKLQGSTYRMKDFSNLNPQKLKVLVSWPTAVQFRGIVCGWYRQRTATTPSQLDDTFFLFRNSDVGILDMGRSGTELGRFLRSNAAFHKACDRVRVSGVQPYPRSEVTSGLEEQLRMEFRFDPSSTSRENMLRTGHLNVLNQGTSSGSSAKVNNLLQSMQVDAATCASVLSLTYLILDFARAICVARQLVAITAAPSARGAHTSHPLDTLHREVGDKRAKVEKLKLVMGLHESQQRSLMSEGVNSFFRVCAGLQAADLHTFFRISASMSARFAKLREFVTEGLAAVLLDQEQLQLGEFVCRQALRSDEVETTGDVMREIESVPRVSSKFSKIVDSELGFELVLRALQNLRVLDIVNAKGNRLATFAKKNDARINVLVHSEAELRMDSTELQSFAPPEESSASEHPYILREVTAYAAKREKLRAAQEAEMLKEQTLRKGYEVAQVLLDLIAAAAHLSREDNLYREDVHQHIVNAHEKSPLIALCLWAQSAQREPTRARQHSLAEAELDCCRRLLSLGASPVVSDSVGRSPVALAALSGRADLLQVMLTKVTQEELRAVAGYAHLVWHTLLATAGAFLRVGAGGKSIEASCVELLLLHDFPAEAPSGCDCSCLELAALLQFDASLLMKLCEARRSVPPTASLLRTNHFLMLRGPRCPVEVVELLMKRVGKSILTELYCVLSVLSDEMFTLKVIRFHASHFSQLFESISVHEVERQLCGKIKRALLIIKEGRPHVPRHITSTVDVDLAAACCAWDTRENSMKQSVSTGEETPSDIFELTFSSRNAALVRFVMEDLSSAHFVLNPGDKSVYFKPPRESRDDADDVGFLLSQIICCACVNDSSGALVLLEKIYTSWCLGGDHLQQNEVVGEEEAQVEVLVHPLNGSAPTWSELLHHCVRCAELSGHIMSPLEVAVQCNSGPCVAYLLDHSKKTPAICGLFVKAICSGHTDQHTALLLLQHLTREKEHADRACVEFEDLDSFLSCMDHSVSSAGAESLQGETILHLCCRRGYDVLVKHLLELGADPLLYDDHGYSSLDYAIAGGHREVTRLMYPYCSPKIQQAITVLVYMTRKFLLSRGRLRN